MAEEYFALHLYLTVAIHRRDWLLGVLGANDARKLLYELALEANGRRACNIAGGLERAPDKRTTARPPRHTIRVG